MLKWFTRKPVPLCKDCKWYGIEINPTFGWSNHICNHPKARIREFDSIKGDWSYAPIIDRDDWGTNPCGKKGKLFEAIE